MNAVQGQYKNHPDRHRDPARTLLTALCGLGHLAAVVLLGTTADHQLSTDRSIAAPPARTLPDHDPAGQDGADDDRRP